MASFTPKAYDITNKTGAEKLLLVNTIVWSMPGAPLFIIDQGGALTAAQVNAYLAAFVASRQSVGNSRPVTELLPTTA